MMYSSFVFKSKLGLVSLVVLASLLSSQHAYAMDDEKKPSISDMITNLQNLANKGYGNALCGLAHCYLLEQGVEKDYEKARDCFERAADKGDSAALYALGAMYRDGLGVDRDQHQARDLFERGAKQGDATCQYSLGVSYHCENIEKEIKYLQLAANQGYVPAACELALMHHEWGISYSAPEYNSIKNNEKAFNYLKSIVDRNKNFFADPAPEYVWPKLFMSMMYLAGNGAPQDGEEGLKYYNSATDSQNDPAVVADAYAWCYNLTRYTPIPVVNYLKGLMCRDGRGTEQNYFEAAKNFGAAANKGFLLAEEALDNACELASKQVDELQILATGGEVLYELGTLYDKSCPEKAFKYYQWAADVSGWLPAHNKVGEMYFYGVGTTKNLNKAMEYLYKAAYSSDYVRPQKAPFPKEKFLQAKASAHYTIGIINLQRHEQPILNNTLQFDKQPIPSDDMFTFLSDSTIDNGFEAAIKHLTMASKQGNPIGDYTLACMYYTGEGTPQTQNFPLAFQWYMHAAKQNHINAQLALFHMFFAHQGVPEDFRLSDLKKLVESSADVQLEFGKKYWSGQGVRKSNLKTYKYFARAVKLGYSNPLPLAQGCTLDGFRDSLLRHFKLGAVDGNINAQYVLGDLSYFLCRQKINDHTLHKECKNLYEKAIHYLTLVADKGHALAQKKLGSIYNNGLGFSHSFIDEDGRPHEVRCAEKEALALKYWRMAADQGMVISRYNWRYPFKTVGSYFKKLTEAFKQFQNPQLSLEENITNFKRSQPLSADQLAFLKKLVTFVKTEDTIEEKSNVLSVNNTHETKESTEQESGLSAFFTKTEVLTNEMFIKSENHSPAARFKKSPDSFFMTELHPLYRKLGEFGQKMDNSACDIQKNLKTPGFMVTGIHPRYSLATCGEQDTEGAKNMCCFLWIDKEWYSCMGDTAPLGYKLRTLLNEKGAVLQALELLENNLTAAKIRTDVTDDQYAQIDAELALLPRAREAINEGCQYLTGLPKVHLSNRNKGFEKENELFFH